MIKEQADVRYSSFGKDELKGGFPEALSTVLELRIYHGI